MNGIVMDGGIGAHANTRIVTDTTKAAMTEVAIGFIPDVGGTYLLSRAPGVIGLHAGLTGASFSGADAIAIDFADHYVLHDNLADLTRAIVEEGPASAIAAHAIELPASHLLAQRDCIDECYRGDTVAEIITNLRHDAGSANDAANLIISRSRIALAVTLTSVRRAATLASVEDVLALEYRVSSTSLRSHDLVEGIRAQLVDKDDPKWSPPSLAAVTDEDVDAHFEPVDDDLTFQEGTDD